MDTTGMLVQVDAEIAKLQTFRAALAAFSANGSPLPASRALRKPARAVAKRKAGKARVAKAADRSRPRADANPVRTRARQLWDQGKSIAEIAKLVDTNPANVSYWKKADAWPAQKAPAEGPRRRCGECNQTSTNPDKCAHCGEPWA
jgi:hypothetical protein